MNGLCSSLTFLTYAVGPWVVGAHFIQVVVGGAVSSSTGLGAALRLRPSPTGLGATRCLRPSDLVLSK